MNGMPKVLNTKKDYLNCLGLFPAETKVELQRLLDDRMIWSCIGEIGEESYPIVDATHKVIADEQTGVLNQYEYIEDAQAKMFRLGFTVEEIEELIGE